MSARKTSRRKTPAPRVPPAPIGDVAALPMGPRQVAAEFKRLVAGGAELRPVGTAAENPARLLAPRYLPRHRVDLYSTRFYLADFRYEEGLNYMPAYVAPVAPTASGDRVRRIHPRIFYKDSTLLWRVASHMIRSEHADWIGKGDVKRVRDGGEDYLESDEDSTNLPYEIQGALDEASRARPPKRDAECVALMLRNAPDGRIEPYAEFTAPRRRAEREAPLPRCRGGRPVARIVRAGDPESLRFVAGYEPDFERAPIATSTSASKLYGGAITKYRILSRNGLVQYQFVASPEHVWVNPPQTLRDDLTSFGLRALHVQADDSIFIPGYEYHFLDESVDPPELHSQIPDGFAGPPSTIDPARADASAWIEALPVIRDFRRRVLRRER